MTNKCVCCGDEIPEGRQVCPNCEASSVLNGLGLNIIFKFNCGKGGNPCLHIDNSYLVQSGEEIKNILNYIRSTDGYKRLQEAGYTRTHESEYQEWKAHNFLYRIGYKRDRTKSVDIDQNEPKWRKFMYAILSIF